MFWPMKDRRTQIVEAATAVMRRQGYGDTSIDEVIRESGLCGKGHFYHYFKSKEELGYAVLKLQFETFTERGLVALRDPTHEPIERLTHFIDAVISAQGGCPAGTPCGALATEMASQHEGFRQLVDALFQRWADQIEATGGVLSFCRDLREPNRGDNLGWLGPREAAKRLSAVFLHHPDHHERLDQSERYVEVDTAGVEPQGSTSVERLLSLVMMGDLVAIYLAALNRAKHDRGT